MPSHATFIALDFPFSSYVPIINIGIVYKIAFAPKFFLIEIIYISFSNNDINFDEIIPTANAECTSLEIKISFNL